MLYYRVTSWFPPANGSGVSSQSNKLEFSGRRRRTIFRHHVDLVRVSIAHCIALSICILFYDCILNSAAFRYLIMGYRAPNLALELGRSGSVALAAGVGAMAGPSFNLRQSPLPGVITASLRIRFAYLVITLYCILISTSYRTMIRLLLALCLPLARQLLLLLVDLLLELDDAGLDPRMLERLLRCHPLVHLPLEALVHEVDEEVVVALHHFGETLCVRYAYFPLGVRVLQRPVVVVEEDLSSRCHDYHRSGRNAFHLHNALDLLLLVLSSEDREPDVELIKNTAQ